MAERAAAQPVVPTTLPASTQSADAADLYREACARLDADPATADEDQRVIGDAATVRLDAAAARVLGRHAGTINLLRRGALLDRCDWDAAGRSIDDILPNLNRFRALAMLCVLQARVDARDGHPDAAADDLVVALALGRQVGRQTLLVTQLVAIGIQEVAVQREAALLPDLSPEQAGQLDGRLKTLPPAVTYGDILLGEYAYGERTADGRAGGPSSLSMVRATKPAYEALAKAASGEPAEFEKAVDALVARLRPDQILFGVAAPSFRAAYASWAKTQSRVAMLRAAVSSRVHGDAALKNCPDPVTGQPFTKTFTGEGFRLSASYSLRGKPVALEVGGAP